MWIRNNKARSEGALNGKMIKLSENKSHSLDISTGIVILVSIYAKTNARDAKSSHESWKQTWSNNQKEKLKIDRRYNNIYQHNHICNKKDNNQVQISGGVDTILTKT